MRTGEIRIFLTENEKEEKYKALYKASIQFLEQKPAGPIVVLITGYR